LAPEQADDAHSVDIRADLYSLGCTLYYLLAGEVPFPARTAVQKLFLHRDAEPTPLEQLRSAVPAEVVAGVRRGGAERREGRFQPPAELAHTLAVILSRLETTTSVGARVGPSSVQPLPTAEPFPDLTATESKELGLIVRPRPRSRGRRSTVVGIALLLLGLVTVGLIFAFRS